MNHLERAIKKSRRFSDTRQWVGYLIPVEIIALVEAGAKPTSNGWDVEQAREDRKKGIGGGHWFYFYPPRGIAMNESRHDQK